MNAIDLISEERKRQIEQESWSASHDDTHTEGELALAAACYASPEKPYRLYMPTSDPNKISFHHLWPESWALNGYGIKSHGRKRQLVIAGALIAAEIDRLQRMENEHE